MKWATFDRFLELGAVSLPAGNFVAVGIASSSEVDLCIVGGHVLGTQRIVPASDKVEAVRGFRVGPMPSGAAVSTVGQKLVLQLYECGDALIPPGPRSPVVVSSGFYAVSAGIAGKDPILRLPFSGRKQAVFCIRHDSLTEGGAANTILVRGVRYNTRQFQKVLVGILDGSQEPSVVDDDATFLQVVTTSLPDSEEEGTIFHIGGGGDDQAGLDELELYAYNGAGTLFCVGEASGERG